VRGFSAVSLLLVDEAARVSDELYLAVRADAGSDAGHAVADQHAIREKGILLRDVDPRREGVGPGAGTGGGMPAHFAEVSERREKAWTRDGIAGNTSASSRTR
jgi:hypothetical protein